MQLSYFLVPASEGGEKTRLGGAMRREEQLVTRAGMSTDRDGTDDDLRRDTNDDLCPTSPRVVGSFTPPRGGSNAGWWRCAFMGVRMGNVRRRGGRSCGIGCGI
jgi:hypothetical protein